MRENEVNDQKHEEVPIHIDNKMRMVPKGKMTGAQLRTLFTVADDYELWQIIPGKQDDLRIQDSMEVELEPGIHFITNRKIVTPGADTAPGPLLPADIEYLKEKEYDYEIVSDSKYHYLTIKDYPLPAHYNISKTNVLILIKVAGYPMTEIDMFYVNPYITYKDGRLPDRADQYVTHIGKSWQRFSRHYKWRAGVDSIASHLKIVQNELSKTI